MRALGLDIGSSTVKAVLVDSGWTGWKVVDTVEVPLAGRTIPEAVAEAQRGLVDPAQACCVGLDRSRSLFRTLEFPFSDPAKIEAAAPFAAEEVLPVELAKVRVGHLPAVGDGRGRFKVPIHAVPREMIEERLAAVGLQSDAGCQLDSVGALEALLAAGLGPTRELPRVLLVDVGEQKTSIELIGPEGILASRSLKLGTARMAEAVGPHLGVEAEAAGRALLEAFGDSPRRPAPETAQRALLQVFEGLAAEIQRTLLGVVQDPAGEPGRILVSGGGARIRLLTTVLAERLPWKVEVLPVRELANRGLPCPERFATALGLALVAAERGRIGLELGPRRRLPVWQDPWAAGILGLALLLAAAGASGRLWLRAYALETEAEGLGRQTEEVLAKAGRGPQVDLDGETRKLTELLDALRGAGRSPLAILDGITDSMPLAGELRLSRLLIEGSDLRIEGRSESFVQVQELERALVAHPGFHEVRFEDQRSTGSGSGMGTGKGTSTFVLLARIREEGFR